MRINTLKLAATGSVTHIPSELEAAGGVGRPMDPEAAPRRVRCGDPVPDSQPVVCAQQGEV
jgi:hypothetical protein